MNKEQKVQVVQDLQKDLARAQVAVVVENNGMTVDTVFRLRKALREKGGKLKVVKNTLLKLASQNTAVARINDIAGGPIAIAYTLGDPAALAKELTNFAKKEKVLSIRGAVLGGSVLNPEGVQALADMPPLPDMRARVLALFNSPAQNFLGLLQAAPRNMLGVLKAREQKLAENG